MKKSCELCGRAARMYCESDEASLCWNCDERVHAANFLVAKHSRNLLCHVCQSVTPWKASGSKFGPTFSVCRSCFSNEGSGRRDQEHQETESPDRVDEDFDGSDDEENDESEEEEEEEEGENQVVPWTAPSSSSSPPPVAATSSSEIGSPSARNASVSSALKRFRENLFPDSEEDGCCSSEVSIWAGAGEDDGARGLTTTTRIGRPDEPSQQWQRDRERGDSEWKRIRRMDVGSSFMRF